MVLRLSGSSKLFCGCIPYTLSSSSLRFPAHSRLYSRLSMPEWYPVGDDAFNTIQPCKNLIVRLPSDNYKVVDLKSKRLEFLFKNAKTLV